MTRVVLYFGSFNPIHRGHLAIASKAVEVSGAKELWFVVSPQNPFKELSDLAPEDQRLEMVRLAIDSIGGANTLKTSDIEFDMPRPSRTIDTIDLLREKYPEIEFVLLMGSDNAINLDGWKQCQRLVDSTEIYVYPREGYDYSQSVFASKLKAIEGVELLDFMSTDVRGAIAQNKDSETIKKLIPSQVLNYINTNKIYRSMTAEQQVLKFGQEIENSTTSDQKIELLMARARVYMQLGQHGNALNDYREILALDPENIAAQQGAIMANDILEFRYVDIYNP